MKKTINTILIIILSIFLFSCENNKVFLVNSSNTIYVRKIENLDEDFIMGADVSSVISLENSGVKFYDFEGNEEDIFRTLAQSGITHIRVRVWNDPYDSNGNSYGGGNCDINNAIEIGKRAKQYGLKLIVDFHYSDFWADPSKQMCPKAWQGMDIETKANSLYEYTKYCLTKLKDEKIDVAMVQLGNETNGKLAGETTWMNIVFKLMTSGSKAIREVYPKALIAVHFANPEKTDSYYTYASKLDYYDLDYDVFASSYYPYWHGTLENLQTVLSDIASTYDKKVMVMETSYAYTSEDFDFNGNTISSETSATFKYPFSIHSQVNCMLDIIETMANTTNGIGVCYWEPAWITVGQNSYEENSKLWEEYGSGWASSYAKEYDPNDAGKYYGGSAVDNQALFDSTGHPLESLKVFALARIGNIIDLFPYVIEDTNIQVDINSQIDLPQTVNAIMIDGSKQVIDVKWIDVNPTITSIPGNYRIVGSAKDMIAICNLSIVELNYIANYSFELDDNKTQIPNNWNLINNGNPNELYVEDKVSDSLSGNKHYHFWSDNSNKIDFNLEQELANLKQGKYKFSMSIMGGDCINQNIYIYVKLNDEIISKENMTITTYNNWDTKQIDNINYNGTDKIVVGIHVETSGQGNGAWGKIDDALFNTVIE